MLHQCQPFFYKIIGTKFHFHGLGALALILGASSQTRLRGIERSFFGAPAETALNNPLEGTQPVKIYCA